MSCLTHKDRDDLLDVVVFARFPVGPKLMTVEPCNASQVGGTVHQKNGRLWGIYQVMSALIGDEMVPSTTCRFAPSVAATANVEVLRSGHGL
jgi:hypothetical protein